MHTPVAAERRNGPNAGPGKEESGKAKAKALVQRGSGPAAAASGPSRFAQPIQHSRFSKDETSHTPRP